MAKWRCLLAIEKKKLNISAYSGHLQVLITFLLKRFLYNMPKPYGDVEISSSFYVLLLS